MAAELLRLKGLDDQVVYDGVYHHSTAYPGLHPIAKAVFLADKLEPNKAGTIRLFVRSVESPRLAQPRRSTAGVSKPRDRRVLGAGGRWSIPRPWMPATSFWPQGLKFRL